MSIGENDRRDDEIIIVRRHGGDDEGGHHGGVWKIAYADFMTAMMAFFLVMWLVNASDRETRRQVATYFNPIKLSDAVSSRKGIQEMQSGNSSPKTNISEGQQSGAAGEKGAVTDEQMFRDPAGILELLARQASADSKGKPYDYAGDLLDPFHPSFRQLQTDTKSAAKQEKGEQASTGAKAEQKQAADARKVGDVKHDRPGAHAAAGKPAPEDGADGAAENLQPPQGWSAKVHRKGEKPADAETKKADPEKSPPGDPKAAALNEAVLKSLADLKGIAMDASTKIVSDGVLISLADKADFAMFNLSSAVPNPRTVVFFERLAERLKKRGGSIVVAGHTDALKYRDAKHGNWRLSTDRALAVFHMLVRGGMPPARIERVEGYAATRPRMPEDPDSGLNRRVELLIRVE